MRGEGRRREKTRREERRRDEMRRDETRGERRRDERRRDERRRDERRRDETRGCGTTKLNQSETTSSKMLRMFVTPSGRDSGCGWRRRPADMEGSREYIE